MKSEKKIDMNNQEIIDQLQKVIDDLGNCRRNNKDCRKCKLRKDGCLLFIRDSLIVALQFILVGLNDKPEKYNGYNMFT